MKILMVSTVFESTPPAKYGGTERVVSKITEGLVARGHDVILFASGQSKTKGKLVISSQKPLFRSDVDPSEYNLYRIEHLCRAAEYANQNNVDIVHFHELYPAVSFCRLVKAKSLITIHLNISPNFIGTNYTNYLLTNKDLNYVAISNSQKQLPLKFVRTIYNGTTVGKIKSSPKGDYIFWIGRITKDKGTDKVIKIARRAGIKIIIAGKLEKLSGQRQFFRKFIRPFLNKKDVVYVGEISEKERNEYMQNALLFLNPIDWDEPFGLVITESMAQGTPVVSFAKGSPEEIIEDGRTGFLVNANGKHKQFIVAQSGIDGMVQAVKKIMRLSEVDYQRMSERCIEKVREKFSDEKMVDQYEELYQELLKQKG